MTSLSRSSHCPRACATTAARTGSRSCTRPSDPENRPLARTLASKAITGAWAHYPVAAGGSTTVWVLVDDERLARGQPELKPVVRAIASGISGLEVADHRTALASYAELRGL